MKDNAERAVRIILWVMAVLVLLMVAAIPSHCQTGHAAWPGQAGNTVGYAGYGALSSTACGAATSGSSWATATTIHDCKYSSAQTVSCNFCIFRRVDFAAGTGGTLVSGSNVMFEGCRFQSNQVAFYNVKVTGTNDWFIYPSVVPLTGFYTSPPGTNLWPSFDAARQNSSAQTNGGTSVNGSDGYQYGILLLSSNTTITYGADIWGFGNSFDIEGPPSGNTWLLNSWIHDSAYAATQGYHTDGPGYLNGTSAPSNVYLFGNVVAGLGNTNAMAFQAATSGYSNMNSVDNYWSGFGNTMSPGDIAPQHFVNSNLTNQFFGTDVLPNAAIFHGTTLGSGTVWACNQIVFAPSTTWTLNGYTPVSGDNGKFWVLSNGAPASTTDQGGNTVCGQPSPSNLGFIDVSVGSNSATQTVTLTNTASSTLTVSSVALAAGGSSQFAITGGTCSSSCSLTAGQSKTIIVQYNPTSLGPTIDQLQISDNMTGVTSPQLVPLLGVGVAGVATPTFSPVAGSYSSTQTVTISSATTGATLCYTTDGSTPTANGAGTCTHGTTYTTTVSVATSETLKAVGSKSGNSDSAVGTAVYTIAPQVATPTFSPVAGTYTGTQSVTISTTTTGATLCYTTDGSTPTANGAGTCTHGTTYSTAVTVSVTETLNAIGSESGFSDSAVGTAAYTINPAQVATPTFLPVAGSYIGTQSIAISTTTGGATICYTTDGSTPTANGAGTCTHGTTYTVSVVVSVSETIKAVGSESGFTDSSVGSAAYTITTAQVATPTFSPGAGTYTSTQTVTISSTTLPTICYTTDGSTPTANGAGTCVHGTTYSGTVSVAVTETLNAIGSKAGYTDSTVGTAAYTITTQVATPTFSPIAGTYTTVQSVGVSTTTGGATLCFTIDGTTPTANGAGTCTHGTTYSSSISVGVTQTIKAIGSESGFTDSSVGSALYTINLITGPSPTGGIVSSSGTFVTVGSIGIGANSNTSVPTTPAGLPILPLVWVCAYELDNPTYCNTNGNSSNPITPTFTVTYPVSGTGGSWSCGATNYGPYTASSQTSLQQAFTDIEACVAGSILFIIPANTTGSGLFSGTNGIVVPQSHTTARTFPIIVRSSMDSSLPDHQIVCTHGFQKNISTATDISISNPDCTGQNMSITLGPSTASGVISGVTTLSTNTAMLANMGKVNTSGTTATAVSPVTFQTGWSTPFNATINSVVYSVTAVTSTTLTLSTSAGTQTGVIFSIDPVPSTGTFCAPLTDGYVSAGINEVVDVGGNQETVTTTALANQTGMCGIFTKTHIAGTPVQFCVAGCSYLLNGSTGGLTTINTANYNDVQYMYTIESTGVNKDALVYCSPTGTGINKCAAGTTGPGPNGWVIEDAETRENAGNTGAVSVVQMQSGTETSIAQLPNHVHMRKMWSHGDWRSLRVGANQIASAFHLGCGEFCSITDSSASMILRPGGESHVLTYDQGGHTIKIVHNSFSGGSIGSLCGGVGTPGFTIPGLVPCQDMQFGRNEVTEPYSWTGLVNPSGSNPFWPNNFSALRKNAWECKECQRVVVYANSMSVVDDTGGQNGIAVTIDGANSSSGQGSNYQSIISDVTLANNEFDTLCSNMLITARAKGAQGGVAQLGGRFSIINNIWYNVTNNNAGCSTATAIGFQFGNYDTATWTGTIQADTPSVGLATFTAATASSLTGNPVCAPGNTTLCVGMAQFDLQLGDPVSISGCTATQPGGASLNTPSGVIFSGFSGQQLGPGALAGTSGLVLVYAYTGTGAVNDNLGGCTFSLVQGGPRYINFVHNTSISDKVAALTVGNSRSNGAPFSQYGLYKDSIITGGGWVINGSAIPEGLSSQQWCCDLTTASMFRIVLPTRTASLYTEFGNNPNFPDPAGCTSSGCSPPTTWAFPLTAQCTGSTTVAYSGAGTGCVGFAGKMSAGSFVLQSADPHDFVIRSDSSFFAGASFDASDGTSMGANISAIDSAQTTTTYVCPYVCGSPGPFPD